MVFPHEYLGVQEDGTTCGFWAATVCMLLAFGVDVTSAPITDILRAVGPTETRLFWKDIATEFCSDKEGVRRATIEPFLNLFIEDLDSVFDGKDCVSEHELESTPLLMPLFMNRLRQDQRTWSENSLTECHLKFRRERIIHRRRLRHSSIDWNTHQLSARCWNSASL